MTFTRSAGRPVRGESTQNAGYRGLAKTVKANLVPSEVPASHRVVALSRSVDLGVAMRRDDEPELLDPLAAPEEPDEHID
jgi:hypothetical protein